MAGPSDARRRWSPAHNGSRADRAPRRDCRATPASPRVSRLDPVAAPALVHPCRQSWRDRARLSAADARPPGDSPRLAGDAVRVPDVLDGACRVRPGRPAHVRDGAGLGRGRLRARRVRAKRLGHEPGLRLLAASRRRRAAVRAVHQSQSRRHLEPARPLPVFRLFTVAPRGRLPFPCVELAGARRSRPRRPQPGARPGDAAADRERGCGRIAIGDGGPCGRRPLRGDRRTRPGAPGTLGAVDGGDCDQRDARGDRLCRSRSPDVARRRDPPARAVTTRRHLARYTRDRPRLPHGRGRVGKLRQRDARVSIG